MTSGLNLLISNVIKHLYLMSPYLSVLFLAVKTIYNWHSYTTITHAGLMITFKYSFISIKLIFLGLDTWTNLKWIGPLLPFFFQFQASVPHPLTPSLVRYNCTTWCIYIYTYTYVGRFLIYICVCVIYIYEWLPQAI